MAEVSSDDGIHDGPLPAGDFSAWLTEIQGALRGERGSDVPCAGCTACCTSSQFIHIAPDETETLARIPEGLLFPAPLSPAGHVVLGYDDRGHCPMLIDGQCSIYEHRPRTCRTYDCRVFPAAGVDVDVDGDRGLIARRARRWRFRYPTDVDQTEHDAVRAAAAFLNAPDLLPPTLSPRNTTELAVRAIEVHHLFLGSDNETGQLAVVVPDPEAVRLELVRRMSPSPAPDT